MIIFRILLLSLFLLLLPGLSGQSSSETMKNLKTFEVRLPVYREGRLQVFIYCSQMERQGNLMYAAEPIIDLIRPGVDVDSIKYIEKLEMYPLDTDLKDILLFWSGLLHSDGIISSPKVTVNSDAQLAYGTDKVFFRSPMLDLNGIGFHADFNKRTVDVKKDVHIRIRTGDKAEVEKGQKSSGQMKAYGDTLFIDFEKELIILEGNVKIDDNQFTITCDRLELFLKDEQPDAAKPDKTESDGLVAGKLGGKRAISRAICVGNVKVNRKLSEEDLKNGAQHAKAAKMVYDVKKSQMILSGGEPVIYRGKDQLAADEIIIWRDNMRLQGRDACEVIMYREDKANNQLMPTVIKADFMDMNLAENNGVFIGNVRLNDPSVNLTCQKMQLLFADNEQASGKPKMSIPGLTDSKSVGGKDLSKIICSENVVLIRKSEMDDSGDTKPEVRATAGRLDYDTAAGVLILVNDNPMIKRGNEYVSGDKITVWTQTQRMVVEHNSRLEMISKDTAGGKDSVAGNSLVTADYFDLDYGKGELLFNGRTKVRDRKLNLDCREMTIFLAEYSAPNKAAASKASPAAKSGMDSLDSFDVSGSGDKEVNKVVCKDDVYIDDVKGKLWCDLVTLFFEPKPPGAEKRTEDRGIAALGKSELVRITSSGNVRFFGNDQTAGTGKDAMLNSQTKLFADRSDMEFKKNYGFLDGNVKMINKDGGLQCEFMEFFLKDVNDEPPPRRPEDEEDLVADRISLGHGKELEKVIAHRDVRLVRVAPLERIAATGNRGVYTVAKAHLILTGTPEVRTKLIRNGLVSEHDYVNYWPNKGLLSGGSGVVKEGGVEVD